MAGHTISVITVCFNAETVIEKTIKSVIGQNYSSIEYIIIDGGSKDGTVEIINKYTEQISFWESEPDKGVYDAMNKGINLAHGEWIIFLNAGDFFHSSDALLRFIKDIKEDTVIAYGLIHYFTPEKEWDMEYIPIEKMEYLDPIPHPATMTRLSYHKEHHFDISFRSSGDYDFFYKAYYCDKVKFQFIPVILTDYDNSMGLSKDNELLIWRENKRVWSRYASLSVTLKMYSVRALALINRLVTSFCKKRV